MLRNPLITPEPRCLLGLKSGPMYDPGPGLDATEVFGPAWRQDPQGRTQTSLHKRTEHTPLRSLASVVANGAGVPFFSLRSSGLM